MSGILFEWPPISFVEWADIIVQNEIQSQDIEESDKKKRQTKGLLFDHNYDIMCQF